MTDLLSELRSAPPNTRVSAFLNRYQGKLDTPKHRQLAAEIPLIKAEQELHDWLCAELDAGLARVFAPSELDRLEQTW